MLTREKVKHHCRIDAVSSAEDDWIETNIKAAARHVEKSTRRKLYDDNGDPLYLADPDALLYGEDIEMAMLMLIGHWYANRETVSVGSTTSTLDFSTEALLQPYRIYGV
ncbi:phage gp6-like head-tail connector protein [Cronobacter sakazakii]|uniref:head-tail connector protein n=1 Tax=Cronobacter sakazakii TaxID=28141 RepID=UPI001AE99E00|nr:head-tail connector protein [Cronobacter sakazakii]EGT5209063.1 phage gp6-like head-tail connector protein [Cronobacter sakazakii]EGT5650494.1 phage gp6-like head-tail connector protein [Cronobacter sakazakii]EGT5750146.1 phage gp6-like head-tail connector protein [Cronobacter sakazakii]EGT5755640.1 phage gp6-like head-tail connector protein [Cronobacter sakazakii]EJG0818396.1 phage gp6-like head-tail connector protein [Cronobacter sakazakii]